MEGEVWFWARRDLWLRGERTAKEGMGDGILGNIGGRSREWTKKKQQKLTDSLRFFVTKGRDDFLFWVFFFLFFSRITGSRMVYFFFSSVFFLSFPFAVSIVLFLSSCALAGSDQMLDGLGNGVVWGAVVGYWELLVGGFFAHSINGINEATSFFICCVCFILLDGT